MKCIPISDARRVANSVGATGLMIIAVDADGAYSFATYGQTKAKCRALGAWADEYAQRIAMMIDDATGDA